MSERKSYYIIATLGTSPAVLTELLYALVAGEGAEVAGLEVWTTSGTSGHSGMEALDAFVQSGAWDELRSALGSRADWVPAPPVRRVDPDSLTSQRATDAQPIPSPGGLRPLLAVPISHDDQPLADVRDVADARALDAALFTRVRSLRQSLPSGVGLLGSLAGGRKTMSAALQSAFSLVAGPADRLVHVLVHPALEQRRDELPRFVVPSREWAARTGVAEEDQITLHDVHFPCVGALLTCAEGADFLNVVERDQFADVIAAQRHAGRRDLRARLALVDDFTGAFELAFTVGGEIVHRVPVPKMEGLTYMALASHPRGLEPAALAQWMIDQGHKAEDVALGEEPSNEALDDRKGLASQWMKRIRDSLETLALRGLGQFRPERTSSRPPIYSIPAAARGLVEVDLNDSRTLWEQR